MRTVRVGVSDLRKAEGEHVDELTNYIEDKLGVKPTRVGDEVILEMGEEAAIPRHLVRDLLKRFLHKRDLRRKYRVLGDGRNYVIKQSREKSSRT